MARRAVSRNQGNRNVLSMNQFPPADKLSPAPFDLVILGAGAAGLMAALVAGRADRNRPAGRPARILLLEGQEKPGRKLLITGGGHCNISHREVHGSDFHGSSPHAVNKVLKALPPLALCDLFADLGLTLQGEPETGNLYPQTRQAADVTAALLRGIAETDVELRCNWNVTDVRLSAGEFLVTGQHGLLLTPRLILATGGWSYPSTGSDGRSWSWVAHLGHTIHPPRPALSPLCIPKDHPLRELSGITAEVKISWPGSGTSAFVVMGTLLCTHLGVSGPAVLDISRHLTGRPPAGPEPTGLPGDQAITIDWCPAVSRENLDTRLQTGGASSPPKRLSGLIPDRLLRTLCESAGVPPQTPCHSLSRDQRRGLVRALTEYRLPITGDRGWNAAEVTAGGVPLQEINLVTMESRKIPGLHICGELCDVDGRLGGFNLHWAWASGFVAGAGAARLLAERKTS
jgi:predicted Rossmann fold flavoprotein